MMKKQVDLIVVIPVGPHCNPVFIKDTISSFIFYTRRSYQIILADDSQKGTGEYVQNEFRQIEILRTPRALGKKCGLYISLSLAYRFALCHFYFDAMLRLDSDALVIGPEPEKEALQLFCKNKRTGIAGQYGHDYDGNPWDTAWPRQRIINATGTWKLMRRPIANWILRKWFIKAQANGYNAGENVFGGAYFMSETCLTRLLSEGLLPDHRLSNLNLEEDHLFSLLIKAIGYELADLSIDHATFGCSWKGLPVSPEQLQRDGKKIVHSTRYWKNMKEEDIRLFFLKERMNAQKQDSKLN